MARPKTLKKPSKARIDRTRRRRAKRFGWTANDGWIYSDGTRNYANQVSFSSGTSAMNVTVPTLSSTGRFILASRQVTIESLDQGVTWHDRETMQPAMNLEGRLLMATTDWGVAPETMRPGSGVYSFEVTLRGVTDEEARQWLAERQANETQWVEAQRVMQEAQRIRREVDAEASRLRAEEDTESRRRAEVRSEDLLRSHLTDDQIKDLDERGGFWVTSQFGNRYWVTRNTAVRFDENGVAIQRYCIHAKDYRVPRADNALMRKLLLECNEELFLRTANPGQPASWDLFPERPSNVSFVRAGALMASTEDYVAPRRRTGAGATAAAAVVAGALTAPVDAPRVDTGAQPEPAPFVQQVGVGDGQATFVATTNATSATTVNEPAFVLVPTEPGLPVMDLRLAPILFWVNGVVRSLTG